VGVGVGVCGATSRVVVGVITRLANRVQSLAKRLENKDLRSSRISSITITMRISWFLVRSGTRVGIRAGT